MIMDNGDCVKSVTYLVDGEYAMTVAWDVFVGKHIDTEKDVDVEVNQLWSYKDILFKVVAPENDTVKAVANEGFTWEGIKGNFIANFTFEAEHYSQ
jgi:hypothetical protein